MGPEPHAYRPDAPPLTAAQRAALGEIARRRAARPCDYVDPLPGQLRFAECTARRKIFRAGNQAKGKTTAGIMEALAYLLGYHPLIPTWVSPFHGPTRGFQVAGTHGQSLAIQRKIAALVPKDELAPGCYFDPKKGGYVGKYPMLRLRNGSWMRFVSGEGDTISLASETLHFVWIDEPPASERVVQECERRMVRTNGFLFMTFTPVNRPVEYLKEQCKEGLYVDIHDPLTPESLIHTRSGRVMRLDDGTPCDEAWIAEQRRIVPEHVAGVLLDGDWESKEQSRAFSAWVDADEASGGHLTSAMPAGDVRIYVGIDHGTGAGGNAAAVLVAIQATVGGTHVWVLDECHSEARTSIDQDAANILAMVHRNVEGGWSGLSGVYGDIPAGEVGDVGRKSNHAMLQAIGRKLGVAEVLPRIRTVKRLKNQRGSVYLGTRYIHNAMVTSAFHCHPRAATLRECLGMWKWGDSASKYKHMIDALRYAIAEEVQSYGRGAAKQPYIPRIG